MLLSWNTMDDLGGVLRWRAVILDAGAERDMRVAVAAVVRAWEEQGFLHIVCDRLS